MILFIKFKNSVVDRMLNVIRRDVIRQKDNIVNESQSKSDVVHRMRNCIDNLADRFIQSDKFLNTVPETDIENLKVSLEKMFELAFQDKAVCFY